MRRIAAATLLTVALCLPGFAQQKPPFPGAIIEQRFTVDIFIDPVEQKLIDRGKACDTAGYSNSDKILCRTEMWNIYSSRAIMKLTCLQFANSTTAPDPNSVEGKLARTCADMVNGADNFIHEVLGVSRDTPAKPK